MFQKKIFKIKQKNNINIIKKLFCKSVSLFTSLICILFFLCSRPYSEIKNPVECFLLTLLIGKVKKMVRCWQGDPTYGAFSIKCQKKN